MALAPSEALAFAAALVANRATGAMPNHQQWVRRLFYAMERAGLWRPVDEDDGTTTDPLHVALASHFAAEHLTDLKRDQLLAFCDQAHTAAASKLEPEPEEVPL